MAPLGGEDINVDFLVIGYSPIETELIFPGQLLPAEPPYGGDLSIPVPLVESFARSPDVSVVQVNSTIGPLSLTYYEHRHGKLVRYKPSGIVLPPRCPADGFPFALSPRFRPTSGRVPARETLSRLSAVASRVRFDMCLQINRISDLNRQNPPPFLTQVR